MCLIKARPRPAAASLDRDETQETATSTRAARTAARNYTPVSSADVACRRRRRRRCCCCCCCDVAHNDHVIVVINEQFPLASSWQHGRCQSVTCRCRCRCSRQLTKQFQTDFRRVAVTRTRRRSHISSPVSLTSCLWQAAVHGAELGCSLRRLDFCPLRYLPLSSSTIADIWPWLGLGSERYIYIWLVFRVKFRLRLCTEADVCYVHFWRGTNVRGTCSKIVLYYATASAVDIAAADIYV